MKLTKEQLDALRKDFRLSPRETEVLDLLYEGLATNQEIADRLETSEGAIKGAVRSLYLKVHTRSKHETVLACLERLGFCMGDPRQVIYAKQGKRVEARTARVRDT